ncbi:uncharacterized protein LOC135350111 isoform X2 [Halichondria panicea]|uniref:uncharacterized protein LOC135350111 isoform X2 n=1 Tax=Halichondria panicea TaxID=6063 RepID=UPI00312B848B
MALFQAKSQGLMPDGAQANSSAQKAKNSIKHLNQDFIILSEFSEQVGPVPIQLIPEDGNRGKFDASQFSVRIMTSDYQSSSGKLVGEDTQVLLSEKKENVFAYVHYFSLNDIHARGYVRQYCLSYITSKFYKLVDNFELLKERFCEVTSMLKSGNQRVFRKDLEHHLADLNHTMAELQAEGFSDVEGLDNAQLYLGYDFTMEDVPERDPRQVDSATEDTSEILTLLKEEMTSEENKKTWEKVKSYKFQQKNQFILQPLKDKSSPALKRVPVFRSGSPDSEGTEMPHNTFADSFELTSSTSSDHSQYQPQRVMTHTVHKFERRLRSLGELAPAAYSAAMEKLRVIHKFFSRSEATLEMEKEETPLLDPRSSLLSIGRVPMINFMQNFSHFLAETPCPLLHPRPYQISCRNTWGQPSEAHTFHKDVSGQLGQFVDSDIVIEKAPKEEKSGFDPLFMTESYSLLRCPLYIDLSYRSHASRFSSTTSYFDNSLSQSVLSHTLIQIRDSPSEKLSPDPDSTNEKQVGGLTVGSEEDRGSPAYHTPVTGLTPSSSSEDGKGVDGSWAEPRPIDKVSQITTGFDSEGNNAKQPSEMNRTLSQQSFSSAVDTGSSQSLHSEFFGGKTKPSVTTSDVTAKLQVSSRSRSLSPSTPASEIDGDVSTDSVPCIGESWEDWGPTSRLSNMRRKQEHVGLFKEQIEEEESHSTGSGNFGDGPLHADHTHFQEQLHKTANGHLRVMDGPTRHTEEGHKKADNLPRQISTTGTASPERYYSPMGEAHVFGREPHYSVLSPSRQSIVSTHNSYKGPSVVELLGKGRLPLVSSVDLVECEYKFKPGRGVFGLWKDNPSLKDLIYCLLHGRPLVIVGKQNDESTIRRFVRLLWMFIPGHSSKQQIITWQENPLNVKDLSRVKLVGMSHTALNNMGPHLKKCISHWDVSTGKMTTPPYSGDLLKPILSRTRYLKNEQAFVAHILSVLVDISMKAYVYYHCYKTSRQAASGETTAKVYHSVLQRIDSPQRQRCLFLQHNLGVRGSDVDILEYLLDIIREQQLAEWKNNGPGGTPQDDEPVTFKLHTKQCRESTHKPKRPY